MFDDLDWKGVTKKISGEFAVFIIKKQTPNKKWTSLYNNNNSEKSKTEEEGEDVTCEENDTINNLDDQNDMGHLTNELVEAVCKDNKPIRRETRTKSIAKNINLIMSKYGRNRSRIKLSKKEEGESHTTSKREEKAIIENKKELETFLLVEKRVGSQTPNSKGSDTPLRFGSRSTELTNRPSLLLKPSNNTFNLMHNKNFKSSSNIRSKSKSKKKNDFKVLTIDELIQRQAKDKTNPFKKEYETSVPDNVIDHREMDKSMFDKLKKSRKSIKSFDVLSFARKKLENKKKLNIKLNNKNEKLDKNINIVNSQIVKGTDPNKQNNIIHRNLNSENLGNKKDNINNIAPVANNNININGINKTKKANDNEESNLPINQISKIKSHRILQNRRKKQPLKGSYISNNSVQKSLKDIKKSFQINK